VVRTFCQANNIHYCELATAMQAAARQGQQLYLRVSGHWNDEGNAVAARTIAACLAEQGPRRRDADGVRPAAAPGPQ
jgi:hypothetical protein